jgi:hypothetical protein
VGDRRAPPWQTRPRQRLQRRRERQQLRNGGRRALGAGRGLERSGAKSATEFCMNHVSEKEIGSVKNKFVSFCQCSKLEMFVLVKLKLVQQVRMIKKRKMYGMG